MNYLEDIIYKDEERQFLITRVKDKEYLIVVYGSVGTYLVGKELDKNQLDEFWKDKSSIIPMVQRLEYDYASEGGFRVD